MTFKASNKRERRPSRPVGEGTQLIASVPIREWYKREMRNITAEMLKDYRAAINSTLDHGQVKAYYAQDASASSVLQETMAALNKKWLNIFRNYAKVVAQQFVDKVDQHSKTTASFSLSTAGLEAPKMEYNNSVLNTLNSSVEFNNTLIVGIQQDVHEKIYSAVMVSLTSPDPEQQGTSGIENALREAGHFSEKRIELIARDQNSKVYSSLNTERMRQNGVDQFRWIHSSAGKVPRHSHVEKDGEVFDIDDKRLWEGPKADQGPPGWAINCLPGDASIEFAYEAERIFRRFFVGEMIEITTLRGTIFRGTPNHPILTQRGWIALNDLDVSDHVIEAVGEVMPMREGDNNQAAPCIADLFSTFHGDLSRKLTCTSENDFHGDGIPDSNVDVVDIDGKLTLNFLAERTECLDDFDLAEADNSRRLNRAKPLDLDTVNLSTSCIVSGAGECASPLGVKMLVTQEHGLAATSRRDAATLEDGDDDGSRASILLGDLLDTEIAAEVFGDFVCSDPERMLVVPNPSEFGWDGNPIVSELDGKIIGMASDDPRKVFEGSAFRKEFSRVVKINRESFSGHVYNLQTSDGWYVSGGIVTHNCRCRAIPVI